MTASDSDSAPHATSSHLRMLSFAFVPTSGARGIALQDAATVAAGLNGAVVRELRGPATAVSELSVGDLIARVNGVAVVGRPFAEVERIVTATPGPLVLECVPASLLVRIQPTPSESGDEREDSVENVTRFLATLDRRAVVKRGPLRVQDGSVVNVRKAARLGYVELRVGSIACLESPYSTTLLNEVRLTGRECAIRSAPTTAAQHAIVLLADDDVLVLVATSEEEKTQWCNALQLAIKVAVSDDPGDVRIDVDSNEATLLHRLMEYERRSFRAIPYELAVKRARALAIRMEMIDPTKPTHPDPAIQRSLRDEYDRLEYDRRQLQATMDEFDECEAGKTRAWDDANAAANHRALQAIRRCLPVNVQHLSVDEMVGMATPSGRAMPETMARRFAQTQVLHLLRMDPVEISKLWSGHAFASPASMQTDHLNLLERRALHFHFSLLRTTNEEEIEWLTRFARTLKRLVEVYDSHVAYYGPPGSHTYAREDGVGCPLTEKQCPLTADEGSTYDVDLGFPEGDEYDTTPAKEVDYRKDMASAAMAKSFDGFLPASAADTLGESTVWRDPQLLAIRLNTEEFTVTDRLSTADEGVSTEAFAGVYRNEPVVITRLSVKARTAQHATELAFVGSSLHGLSHERLVPLLGVTWTHTLDIQLVTPRTARGDLRRLLDSDDAAALSWGDGKSQIAIDVADALRYLHSSNRSAGIGSITSRNVLLDADLRATLNLVGLPCRDFAAARDRVPCPLRWLAPEVLMGEPTSCRADMYAFGMLLAELDTTQLPFDDARKRNGRVMDDTVLAYHVARRGLRPPLSRECPRAIVQLVAKCLAQEPAGRPTADHVVYSLSAFLKDES